ncbi:MAG: hypothetical protein LUH59_01580 [Firmicutes bacterium]|nr:hypothetical protein [Bacillota bacterium]
MYETDKTSEVMLRIRMMEYAVYDEEGEVVGLDSKAPDDVKEEYARYLKERERDNMFDRFLSYLVFRGDKVVGLNPNAPADAKAAYERYLKEGYRFEEFSPEIKHSSDGDGTRFF